MESTVPKPGERTLADFASAKNALIEDSRTVERIAQERASEQAVDELQRFTEKIAANRFYLAVLGQFKRGKTTLINALLGDEVLPVAVVPLTSIITIVSYGDQPLVTVHFLSGESRLIRIEELGDYVTERHNPENKKGVKHVEVRYPSPYLKDDILLVDTPGVGSTFQHNTEVTHSFLAKVDAAVFMVSVDPPLTQLEADFLKRAVDEVHHFFFVLNKIDVMTEAEMRESLEFTTGEIRSLTGLPELTLFPVSARLALDAKKAADHRQLEASRLPAFERALHDFLIQDKGEVLLASSLADLLRVASDLRFSLELERKAMAVPLTELQEKQAHLELELRRIAQERDDMNVLLNSDIGQLIFRIESDLREHVEASILEVRKRLDNFYKQHSKAGRSELGRLLDEFMTDQVEHVFNTWRIAEDRSIDETFRGLSSRFTEKTNAIIGEIHRLTANIFGIEVDTFKSVTGLQADSRMYYKTDPLFYFAIDKVPFVLPKFLFRQHVLNKMRERVRMELERNSGRIRYDYLERIEKATEDFRRALNAKIDATIAGIEKALARATEASSGASEEIAELEAVFRRQSEELDQVIERCRVMASDLQPKLA